MTLKKKKISEIKFAEGKSLTRLLEFFKMKKASQKFKREEEMGLNVKNHTLFCFLKINLGDTPYFLYHADAYNTSI